MSGPPPIPRTSGFILRHLVASGAAIACFTAICVAIYFAGVVASGFDIGSPLMPFAVPLLALLFSFLYTLTVVAPSCAIGEFLCVRILHLPWYAHLTATSVIFGLCLWASVILYGRFIAVPKFNLPEVAYWIAYLIPFVIYWPVSRRARL
jgi:hypothetical protein